MPRTAHSPAQDASIDLTVVIPTFRREKRLVQAIGSVLIACSLGLEVLVSDDSPEASARDAVTQINDPRVRYHHRDLPTGGVPARVRNDIALEARGKHLYFLDDDDTASVATLEKACRQIEVHGAGVAIGVVTPHGPENHPVVRAETEHYRRARETLLKVRSPRELAARLMFKPSIICCSSCVISREAFFGIGGFDTDIPLYEDVEMYLQAIRRYGFVFIDSPLLNRLTGEASLIQNETDDVRTRNSYEMMYDRYRAKYGRAEWTLLNLWSRMLA